MLHIVKTEKRKRLLISSGIQMYKKGSLKAGNIIAPVLNVNWEIILLKMKIELFEVRVIY